MSHLVRSLVWSLVVGIIVSGSSSPAQAQIHGFVDPCTVAFVQDNTTTCELCVPVPGDPKYCEKELAPKGYVFKCRATPGHSEPGEVWCAPKDRKTNKTKQWVVTGLATTALALVLVLTRRKRKSAKKSRRGK